MRDREREEGGGAEVEVEREEMGDEGKKREKDGEMDNCERE